jgi:hypothetical protein
MFSNPHLPWKRHQASIPMTQSFHPSSSPSWSTDQLNSTSLKWGSDGELSELDLQRILNLLSQADPVAEALISPGSDSLL